MSASSETACRTSSSVLKKCGPSRIPPTGSGRKSQTTPRSPSSRWQAAWSGVETVTVPPRRSGSREGTLPDPRHPDLLDHVVAGGRGVERGNVGRAGEEAARAGRVLELGLEGE